MLRDREAEQLPAIKSPTHYGQFMTFSMSHTTLTMFAQGCFDTFFENIYTMFRGNRDVPLYIYVSR